MKKVVTISVIVFVITLFSFFGCRTEITRMEKYCGSRATFCETSFDNLPTIAVPKEIINSAELNLASIFNTHRLTFEGCQYVDTCQDTRNYKWSAPIYRLHYNWTQPDRSIVSDYCFDLELDPSGKILNEVEIGNGNPSSRDFSLLTIEEFDEICQLNSNIGFDYYDLSFDTLNKTIIIEFFEFTNNNENSDVVSSKVMLSINAYTGEVLN